MAQYNTGNNAYQSSNKTLFEVNQIATLDGNPVTANNRFPVDIGNTTINISGNVNISTPNTVTVNSTPEDPVHIHITEVGNSGLLAVEYMPIGGNVVVTSGNVAVTGSVNVGNFPSSQNVVVTSGNVVVSGNVSITSGNVNANVSGNVSITNGSVVVSSGNVAVTGIVNVGNIPASQNVVVTSGNVSITSGNVNATVSGNVNSFVYNANGTAVSNTAPLPITGNVSATITGTITSTVLDGQQDAFGRLRTSDAFTLGDYKHTYGIDPNFRDALTNGGTVTHIPNQAAARLATSNNSSSKAIHQTKMYHNYMPGKSQLIKTTINFYAPVANVTKRTGYFDDLNGIYFEQNGAGVLSFVIRTNTSGTASDARRIVQSSWNKDKCDGTGPSGFNLDITKTQIVFIDFQWLGVGRVRCGFVHDGQMIIAHEFYNSNNLTEVYISNPNLPIRCEILNTGTTAGGFFDQICSTVVSEGGYMESGIDFSIDSGQTSQTITVANGMYPVLAIRLKNSFRGYPNRVVVRSGNINIYGEDYPAYWALYKLDALANITLSDATWTSADADSAVEYSLNATAFTGGDRIDGGIVGTTSPGGSAKGTGVSPVNQPSNAKKNFIAQNLDSTDSEIYVICGKAIGGTTNIWVDFQWREIY